ncbi:hypothetical protein LAZ67_11002900, partial [Cordylochernes scorpioides]
MTYLAKVRKCDLSKLAYELGEVVPPESRIVDLKHLILNSQSYEEEFAKQLLETLIEDRERIEERERIEDRKRIEDRERIERERKEQMVMEFELEKLRIQTTRGNNDTSRSTSNAAHYEIRKLMPKYESKDNDLSFYLILFERQAKRLGLDEDQWAFSLLGLLPYEMTQLIARETEEQSGDYRFVKRLLLKRYKLSPEQFRQKFEKHERSQKGSWRDFAFELRGYFNEWIEGMNVENFDALKDLSVTNQLKKKVPNVLRNHLIDDWTKLNNPDELADKLDEYENVRTEMGPPHWNAKHLIPPSFQQKSARFPNQNEVKETKQGTNVSGQDAARNEISETYPNTLRRMVNRTIRNDKGEPKCFNCNQFGHIARDCPAPRTTLTCRGCGQTGHKERNCTRPKEGLKVANLEVEGLETVPPDVYLKDVKIDNKETVKAMIDTGSSSCLMRESVARRISVDIEPDSTSLYGIGNQTAPAARTVGKTTVDLEIDGIVGREITVFIVNDDAQPYDLLIGRTWTDLPYVSFARIGKNLHIGYSSEFPFANLQEEIKSRRIELRATETVQLESDSINFTSAITDEVKDGYVLFTGVDDACVDSLLEVVDGKTTVPIISAGKGKLRVRKNQCVGRVELLNLDDIVVNLDVAEDSFQTKNEEKREGQDQMKRKRPILPEDINVNHSLTSKERQEILDVVNEYRDCFALGMEELGCTDVTKMDIKEVDGSKPVCLRPYKTTASEREAIREIVREWKDNGIVTETRSPYASPVLLVRKKTGDHRLVVDYRRLNIQTVKDKFPLPRIDDLLEGLRNAKFFTTLDLARGYLQIPLTDKAKLKTAFITPDDTGQFERMIFGLANAPAEFQRLMHTVLGPLLNKKAFCYLDDVIIPAKDWREMIERLREVLERIRSAKLTLKPSKCEFGRREVEFLGYVISTGGLKPGPRKIKAIEEFPEPKNVHDIRRFLGLANFFRRFVKDFARKAEPLSRLTKKGSQFEWKEEQRRSFGGLRKDLVEYPVLAHYNPELKTEAHCDASAEGLAGMVLQMDEDCKWRLVYCVSKKTTEAEKMYHSSKLELMAIVWTLDRLRQFLVGIKFTVVTDCQALVYMNVKKTTNPQIARWYNLIQEYDFEIRHKPGEKMAHVDGMSRAPVDDPRDTMEEIVEKNLEVCLTITLEEQILMIQHSDPELRDLIQIFRKDPCDRTVGEQNRINDYSYKGGRLFRMVKNGEEERALYVIPKSMRKSLVVKFHDLMGHFATDRTVNKIKELYWFPSMKRYVRRHVAMCLECLFNKVPGGKQQGFLHPIKSGKRPFSIVHMDHVGPFVRSTKGNQELLVIVDNLTRFVRLSPVRNTSTQNVLKVMKSFVNDFGLPDKIISDRGSCFTSRQFEEFCRGNGIHHTLNSTKHPQGNGMVERVNRTVLSTIATSIEDPRRKDWDLKIKEVERDLNNAVNKTTNKTPFETLHGYSPRFHDGILRRLADEDVDPWTEPDRIQESVRTQIENKQEIMKTYYDKKKCRTIQFEVGEIVVMRHVPKMTGEPTKAQAKYRGPLIITEVLPSDTYRVTQLSERTSGRFYTTTAHISQLKSWHSEEDDSATEESPDEEPEVEDTPRRNPRRSCNARFNRGRLKSRNGRMMVETRSGKMQDPAQERIQAEESAKPQPGATIGRDASSDPVVLNPNIDIPKYDGTEDPRPWIESLEEIGFLYHWADYIISRYAAMNMTGSAKTWLNLHKASFTSWENIKIRLIQDFSLDANKEELRMKLNRMQHWNEPAIRFAEDILVLCNKVDPAMEEETKIEHVIGGLKKEYSFALYLNPPKTTDDLLVVCKKMDYFEKKYRERVEKSRNLYNGPRYSRPQQQSRYVPPTAARNYQTTSRPQAPVSNNYKNDSPPTPRQYRNNFPQPSTPRRPYNPNFVPKPNLQRNTYNKSQEVSKNRTEDGRPICFKCNKPGHVARYCRVKFIRILEEDPADTQEKIFRVGSFKLSVAPESVNQSKSTINGIKKLDPKYKLKINVDKIGTFEALVDTGADLSVVDLRTALDTGHGISKLAKICAGPDGKKLDMVGSIFLNIKIDDETLSHNFVILKTHLRTLILGRDFLKKMNAKIDCKQETIKYDLTNNHDEINFEMLKIKSAKDSIVPECSMKLIKALVETEDGEYIIEESSKMFQTNGLRLARSLINVINRETHIWITNPYPRPLKIMKNQTLAFGSSPAKINVSREREVEKNEEPRFQINENLSPKEQKELKQVLERYGDLFSSRLGRTNLEKHRIDTEDAKPIKHKPYRVSAKERDIIKEQIDEMLTEGIIRPSSSPWSFPVILVKKRDGKYRFCVDYRKLNNVTVKDVYPIPRIDEVMDTLQGSTHFSAIDLRSGYWQVEVEERDKEKTAFTTAHGLYEFNVMPFGLCNAPATFERNMENMLGNLRWQICLCYLDDVIIYSPDFPTHLKRLEAVFRCFRESNLRLNDKKCRFAFEELEILGYITSKHGIKPAEHNIKAVRNFPRPKKVKEVQSFLGMCSYYRKFIKDFSKIADPLTNLIKKSVSFTWTERQEEAFQTLKTALLSPPILGHFNPNAPTYVHTDASNIGIGATLVQDIGGEEKVISYLSRTLSKAEQNYSTTEKECLAVVWSMSKLRPYLYGRHFKIVTDHHALCWLKNLKDPTGRLARWALKIQEYDFDIIHKSGKKHLDADGLSRGPLPETDWDEDFERLFLNQITDEEDKFIESVKKNLNGSRRSIAQNFKEEDGCLFKKNPNPEGRAWLLVVPENKKREIMKEYHNHMSNDHLSVARTMYRIKSKYFWPSMLNDVLEFVKTCHLCQSRKGSNKLPSGLLQPIPPANFPFERIGIDFVGPLPSTKNREKWIIVLTDYYTRYAETKAVSEATVKEVSKFLVEDIFLRHGAPQYLISDRGSQFTSNLMEEVMKMCKIKLCFTTSYHPQTNGLTERLNRTLINMLSMYVNTDQKNWDEILPFITHAYNTTIQETTGYSPFFLMFGREPTSLLDDRNISVDIDKDDYDEYIKHHLDKINRTRKLVINNTIKTQERMKKNYDKKHMERSYEPGELVAVWTPIRKIGKCEKLLRKYFGPYRILKKLSNVNYLIEPKDNPGQDPLIVHVSRIKPYFERIDEVNHEDVTTSGEEELSSGAASNGGEVAIEENPPGYIAAKLKENFVMVEINGRKIKALVDSGADFSVISDKFRRELKTPLFKEPGPILKAANKNLIETIGKCVLNIEVNGLKISFEFVVMVECSHDIIFGWDFFKATEAVIDCGRNELHLGETSVLESREEENQRLFASDDFVIPPKSIKKISVINEEVCGVRDVLVSTSKDLLLRKEVLIPNSLVTFRHGRGSIWVANGASWPQLIPSGMNMCTMESYENGNICSLIESSDKLQETQLKSREWSQKINLTLDPGLSEIQRLQLVSCLDEFIDIFDFGSTPIKPTSTVKHKINTGDQSPIKQRPYRVAPSERRLIQDEVNKMIENHIVKPSESPWSSPVILVRKKDGTWRFCVDYRRLNKITKKDVYPLPRIDDALDSLAGSSYFSTVDLRSGYWQIEVDEKDREKTAFITPDGLYEFQVMPFGLCNAPATFERMIDSVLGSLKWNMCLCYLDDIVVYAPTFEEHLRRLQLVLSCIQKAGLSLNHKKCLFGSRRIKILGHLVDANGIHPDPDKVEAVSKFPRPRNISELKSFLGLCSYYRRFIENFADKARSLHDLLKTEKQFYWDAAQEKAFEVLKTALISEPVLGHFDESADTHLHTDASGHGIGAVLLQIQGGKERPIAYASRSLTKAENNYSTTEKECLAVVWSISKFRPYLFGRPFTVVTDHHSLCWLVGQKDPSGRLARWALKLQEFDVTVIYKSGRKHKDADCLSRSPLENNPPSAVMSLTNVDIEQTKDPDLAQIIDNLNSGYTRKEFSIIDGILYKKNYSTTGRPWLMMIPKHLRSEVMADLHDAPTAGHLGFARTYDKVKKRFYWPGLYRTVRQYVSHCRECQRRKKLPRRPAGQLVSIPPVEKPFYKVGVDLLGRFPVSKDGNRWIIVCTDYMTRYAITKAIPDGGAIETAKFLVEDVILKHGAPREMITDRGRNFISQVIKEINALCGIVHRFRTVYHPQTNGLTERFNKTLGDMLSMYTGVEQKDWDQVLPY